MMKAAIVVFAAALCLAWAAPRDGVTQESRIVNGQLATAGEFPFLVSLQLRGTHFCGATILNDEWLLTAAHCIYGNGVADYVVRVGSNNWQNGGQLHNIAEMEYHANYSHAFNWPNDIGVVKVTPPITFTENVQPTVLADAGSDVDSGTTSIIAGWGATNSGGGTVADDMMRADVVSYSDAECLALYEDGPTEQHICAGGEGTGICGGDSGGPLLANGAQVGITSWSRFPCGSLPAVWTQVSYYRDWILERTGI